MTEQAKNQPTFNIGSVGNLNTGDVTIQSDQIGIQQNYSSNPELQGAIAVCLVIAAVGLLALLRILVSGFGSNRVVKPRLQKLGFLPVPANARYHNVTRTETGVLAHVIPGHRVLSSGEEF